MEHAHVPFPAILWQAKLQWAAKNGKDAPSSFAEKEQFKAVVKSLARDYGRELNFEQAVKESYRAYTPSQLTPSLETLLSSDISGDVNGSSPFSVMLGALRRFVQANDGLLPLSGSIPDMVATTDSFIHLQQIYQRKALEDFKAFSSMLMDELAARGLPANSIGESEAKEFCRRAASIASIGTRSIAEEMTNDEDHSAKLQEILLDEAYSDPAQTPLVWAMCLRAADIFHSRYARFPGQLDGNLENDTEQLYSILLEQWKKWGLPTELIAPPVEDAAMEMEGVNYAVSVAHAVEVVRFAAMEVHNISAIIGGIASQEAAKILTHQYLPIDNTYIFNGIAGCGSSYQL